MTKSQFLIGVQTWTIVGALAYGQTAIDLRTQSKSIDFTRALSTRPVRTGSGLPAACDTGELYIRADPGASNGLYLCASPNTWKQLATGGSTAGYPVTGDGPSAPAQFFGWDPDSQSLRTYTFGSLLTVSGTVIDIATESLPQFIASTPAPSACSRYGMLFFDTAGPNGGKLYYCNGQTYEAAGSPGLQDPGVNGIVKRTAANITAPAAAGTDYYAPGQAIGSTDLPNPTPTAGGKVQAKTCSAGQFVQTIGTDSTVTCGAPPAVSVTQVLDANGATAIATGTAANAVNRVTVTDAAAGSAPSVAATGADANLDLLLRAKGTGKVDLGSIAGVRLTGGSNGQWLQTDGAGNLAFSSAAPAGLPDPGTNGLVKRTAANTTAAAVAGTDYYAPGRTIDAADLPNPGAASKGGVLAKDCSGTGAVQKINSDGSVSCGATGSGSSGGSPAKLDWQPQAAALSLAANTDNLVFDTVVPGGTLGPGGCVTVNWQFAHSTGSGSITYKVSYGSAVAPLYTSSSLAIFAGVLLLCNAPGATGTQQAVIPSYTWGNNAGQIAPAAMSVDSTATAHLQLLANPGASATDKVTPYAWLVQKVN